MKAMLKAEEFCQFDSISWGFITAGHLTFSENPCWELPSEHLSRGAGQRRSSDHREFQLAESGFWGWPFRDAYAACGTRVWLRTRPHRAGSMPRARARLSSAESKRNH